MFSHHATTGVAAYAVDAAATNGAFHLLYDGTRGVVLSDEPQLLTVNLVRSNGSPALTGHYVVDILPQPDILSGQEALRCFRATGASLNRCRRSRARQTRRGRRRPTLRVPLGALQHTTHAAGRHPGQTSDSQISAVARSPDTEVAAPAVPSPSPTLMERLNPAQRSAFLRSESDSRRT